MVQKLFKSCLEDEGKTLPEGYTWGQTIWWRHLCPTGSESIAKSKDRAAVKLKNAWGLCKYGLPLLTSNPEGFQILYNSPES